MDRETLDPEIDALLEDLGEQLAQVQHPCLIIAYAVQLPERVFWWGRWWRRMSDGRYAVEADQ